MRLLLSVCLPGPVLESRPFSCIRVLRAPSQPSSSRFTPWRVWCWATYGYSGAQHEATVLFLLRELADARIVPGLVAYGSALEGALAYLATTLVLLGRPFPANPSQYAPLFSYSAADLKVP